jgi:hypothetical protein
MKLIVAGSRIFNNYSFICEKIDNFKLYYGVIDEIVSGCARGADTLGIKWAKEHGIPKEKIKKFPAKWKVNGKFDRSAGYKRNIEMAKYADSLIAFWDGESKGTRHMITMARKEKLNPIWVIPI